MKKVYMCFSSDIIHIGHINILKKAAQLGQVIVGVLTDEVICSYKNYPLIPLEERIQIMRSLNMVTEVVIQPELDYTKILYELRPDYVVHGDDWLTGVQAPIREKVIKILDDIGGELVEYQYSQNQSTQKIENYTKEKMHMPEVRRPRLKQLLYKNGILNILEAHNGLTGLIVENTKVEKEETTYEFDGMWVSSLCDSTSKGKPDIELLDMSTRIQTIEEIMEVTTKPIILDADTGGRIEHFAFNVRTLERIGVSAVIIEDKIGLKRNSLFGTTVEQTQDNIEDFCQKIVVAKNSLKTKEFMIIARIESLILEKGMIDAITRAKSYVEAGVDGIMIHSKRKEPDEILEFIDIFRKWNQFTPLVVVPTTFNTITHQQWKQYGVNIVIHANQLTRSAFPSMKKVAKTILEHQRSYEADKFCMSIDEILNLIPTE